MHTHEAIGHEHLHVHDEHHRHEHLGDEGPAPHRHTVRTTSADIQEIHAEKGVKHPSAANNFLDVVRKLYNWAKKPAKLIPNDCENPATGIQRFPDLTRKRFITRVEMPRFIEALEQEPSDHPRHGM